MNKYNSYFEWKKDFPREYYMAYSKGFLEEICNICGWHFDLFYKNLELVIKFISENNRLPEIKDDKTIVNWCNTQRAMYKNGQMAKSFPERIALLEAIPEWEWDIRKHTFNHNIKLVIKFVSENNKLPSALEISEGEPIGSWCKNQTSRYKKGKLLPEKIALLEAIPGWKWDIRKHTFSYIIGLVIKFVSENNRLPSIVDISEGESIGAWCNNQRAKYKNGEMAKSFPERIALFEAIPGWYWPKK